jgi:hypothetical protein
MGSKRHRQETTHPLTAKRLALISTAIFGSPEQDHRQETTLSIHGIFFKMILIRPPL